MIAFRIVPIPGISLIGIQRNITTALTTNVASPIVQFWTKIEIPSAKTVQGVFPIPAAIRSESPNPNRNSPITRIAIVDHFGFNDIGSGELHQTVGTFFAGRRISTNPMYHEERLSLEPNRSILLWNQRPTRRSLGRHRNVRILF